jgi:hypothetical protein
LWLRRIAARRTWIAVAVVLVAELVLWTRARFRGARICAADRDRDPGPRAGGADCGSHPRASVDRETALAVDAEGRLGDRRVEALLELAVAVSLGGGPG